MSTSKKEIDELHASELYLYFYEDALTKERTERECDYLEALCKMSGPKDVLDLACGHGRHANALSQRGHRVTGIDMNREFLEVARKGSLQHGGTVDYVEGDILDIDYTTQFDVVLLLFNTLGFFDADDCKKLFAKISHALRPGGKAFIDLKNRDHIAVEIQAPLIVEKGNDMMIDRIEFDPKTGTTTNHRTYLKDGVRYDTPFMMYHYHYNDLERLIENTGLDITVAIGGWKHEPLDHKARRIIVVLKKN